MTAVTIVDSGAGNMASVCRAFRHIGADVNVAGSAGKVAQARRLVIPGVGAFAEAMSSLRRVGLDEAIRAYARSGAPLLGICVGMQIMFDEGEEFGSHKGLGFFRGRVRPIPTTKEDGSRRKVPHIGWSRLELRRSGRETVFNEIDSGTFFYFLHSFAAESDEPEVVSAFSSYGDRPVVAAVAKDNLHGCQFHPEKSGPAGLKLLGNFLGL